MSELGQKARAIVEAGRELDEPNAHDRARIHARLTAALGASAFAGAASQVAASASLEAATGGLASQAASGLGAAGGAEAAALGGPSAAVGGHALSAASAASGQIAMLGAAKVAATTAGSVATGAAAASGLSFALGGKAIALLTAAALSAAAGAALLVATPENATTTRAPEQAVGRRAVQRVRVRVPEPSLAQPSQRLTAPAATATPVERAVASTPSLQADADRVTRSVAQGPHRGVERPASAAQRTAPGGARDGDRAAPGDRGRSAAVPAPTSARPALASHAAAGLRGSSPAGDPVAVASGRDSASGLVARAPVPVVAAAGADASATTSRGAPVEATVTVASAESQSTAATSGHETTAAPALSPELRLLAQAQRALRDGRLAQALDLLDEHADRFPQGALQEERHAARAVTLCRLGNHAAARVETAALEAKNARSPLLPWVRASCER